MKASPSKSGSTRSAVIQRETAETKIKLEINLDGTGKAVLATGIGFFDHMLTLLAKHSLIDLTVEAKGDLHVDAHHTVEDVGICFGKALVQALGDKANIRRYGGVTLPMDEVLVTAAIDLSGRPFCVWRADILPEMLGTFNAPLAEEFWRAVSAAGLMNLHVVCHHGKNSHHIVEGIFKACARALRQAVEIDPRSPGVPSTKGVL
jgi:imidazoleglycerol-phosphate dehydratase